MGCCESLYRIYELLINEIPKLRRLSVTSPYADKKVAADYLEDKYIYGWKPNPASLAISKINWDWIKKDIQEILNTTKGACLEIVMKSNETFN